MVGGINAHEAEVNTRDPVGMEVQVFLFLLPLDDRLIHDDTC